ncbi:CD151 antigen isoform X1 [Monodelphis domestica]|uniref:CD151 antigen isoform X1 n=1 Tax=Monodelphis domestica TaxID=13616 RepID=UPI0024E26632|nr:CD151 antigen isoform X1 [Monodelphis domestica]
MGEYNEKKETCGTICLKYLLFTFNCCFWLAGLAVMAVGVWTLALKSDYISLLASNTYLATAYILVVAGAVVMVTGVLGCCATFKERRNLLRLYFLLLFVIFVLEVIAGILAYIYYQQLSFELKDNLKNTMVQKYQQPGHEGVTGAVDSLQQKFKCCGSNNSQDWQESTWIQSGEAEGRKFPDSCCKTVVRGCGQRDHASNIYKVEGGCITKLERFIQEHLRIIGAVGLGIACVQVRGSWLDRVGRCPAAPATPLLCFSPDLWDDRHLLPVQEPEAGALLVASAGLGRLAASLLTYCRLPFPFPFLPRAVALAAAPSLRLHGTPGESGALAGCLGGPFPSSKSLSWFVKVSSWALSWGWGRSGPAQRPPLTYGPLLPSTRAAPQLLLEIKFFCTSGLDGSWGDMGGWADRGGAASPLLSPREKGSLWRPTGVRREILLHHWGQSSFPAPQGAPGQLSPPTRLSAGRSEPRWLPLFRAAPSPLCPSPR